MRFPILSTDWRMNPIQLLFTGVELEGKVEDVSYSGHEQEESLQGHFPLQLIPAPAHFAKHSLLCVFPSSPHTGAKFLTKCLNLNIL